jgi:hypothetical protein
MDPTIMAAIIGAIATVAAVFVSWFLQRPKNIPATTPHTPHPAAAEAESAPKDDEPRAYACRYRESPGRYRFMKSLPKLRAVVLEDA